MNVVSLFDHTTNMVKPWAAAGHLCWCVDIQHPPGLTRIGNIVLVGADILKWRFPDPIGLMFAFPPCTDVAVSGARWMKDKGLGKVILALQLFKAAVDLAEEKECPYMLENPATTVSTYWRAPDHKFNPNDYGDPYTKETWLWTGNGFVMPPVIKPGDLFAAPTLVAPTEGSKMHRVPPGPNRANIRSETPMGFVNAAFAANAHHAERIAA